MPRVLLLNMEILKMVDTFKNCYNINSVEIIVLIPKLPNLKRLYSCLSSQM
jgi:hypothetical protein